MRMILLTFIAMAVIAGPAWAQAPQTQPAAEGDAAAVAEPLRPILSPQAKRERAEATIDRFVRHLAESDAYEAKVAGAVGEAWEAYRATKDLQELQDFLTAALAMASAPFKQSLDALDEGDYAKADSLLAPLTTSNDPWLSLHARALLARSLVEQDRLEEAEKILTPLVARESDLMAMSFLEAELDFFLGYAQLSNLKYEEAAETLTRFERQHPDAPDMFRLPAIQMLQELRNRRPESLGEVSDLMVYSGRRLRNGEPGKPVQIRQDRAIELLSKLIKQQEEQEQQQSGSSGGGGGGSQQQQQGGQGPAGGKPGSGARESSLPGGDGSPGELKRAPRAKPGEEWGKMRPEEREKILQSLRRNFPTRYRQLIEQYYKQLAKEQ